MTLEEMEAEITAIKSRIENILEDDTQWKKLQARIEKFLETRSETDKQKILTLLKEHPDLTEIKTLLATLQSSQSQLEKSAAENLEALTRLENQRKKKEGDWI